MRRATAKSVIDRLPRIAETGSLSGKRRAKARRLRPLPARRPGIFAISAAGQARLRARNTSMTNNFDLMEVPDIARGAQGGTENSPCNGSTTGAFPARCCQEFQIIPSRVERLREDKYRLLWIHETPGHASVQHLAEGGWKKFHRLVFVSNWQMQNFIMRFAVPWSKCALMLHGIHPVEISDRTPRSGTIRLIYHGQNRGHEAAAGLRARKRCPTARGHRGSNKSECGAARHEGMPATVTTLLLPNRLPGFTYQRAEATWRSGYATVCKFVFHCHGPSRCITEPPDLWAFFGGPSVLHPFPSLLLPRRWVAISIAKIAVCSASRPHAGRASGHRSKENRAWLTSAPAQKIFW
jgi:hypothetical protein